MNDKFDVAIPLKGLYKFCTNSMERNAWAAYKCTCDANVSEVTQTNVDRDSTSKSEGNMADLCVIVESPFVKHETILRFSTVHYLRRFGYGKRAYQDCAKNAFSWGEKPWRLSSTTFPLWYTGKCEHREESAWTTEQGSKYFWNNRMQDLYQISPTCQWGVHAWHT